MYISTKKCSQSHPFLSAFVILLLVVCGGTYSHTPNKGGDNRNWSSRIKTYKPMNSNERTNNSSMIDDIKNNNSSNAIINKNSNNSNNNSSNNNSNNNSSNNNSSSNNKNKNIKVDKNQANSSTNDTLQNNDNNINSNRTILIELENNDNNTNSNRTILIELENNDNNTNSNRTILIELENNDNNTNSNRTIMIELENNATVIILYLYDRKVVVMNYTVQCDHPSTVYELKAISKMEDVAYVVDGFETVKILCSSTKDYNSSSVYPVAPFEVQGEFNISCNSHEIGRAFFEMHATKIDGPDTQHWMDQGKTNLENDSDDNNDILNHTLVMSSMIIVMQPQLGLFDEIYSVVIVAVMVLITAGMGVEVEFDVIKKVLKKPVAPLIGLFCQYLCMPLIAYLIAKTIPQKNAALSLGIFTCGVVPGGGMSNLFSLQLGGDVTLSITMTTVSSISAFGLIPLWMLTLGKGFSDETTHVVVPFKNILQTVAMVVLPPFLGMFIKWKFPKAAAFISKILIISIFIISLVFIGIGLYKSMFIFKMIEPQQILAGCLLPYIGYILGGSIAFMARLSWKQVKTIAIETGIQNTGIATMMLYLSLDPPDNMIATIGPIASSLMTPVPLIPLVVVYQIYTRCKKRNTEAKEDEVQDQEEADNKQTEAGETNSSFVSDSVRKKTFLDSIQRILKEKTGSNEEDKASNGHVSVGEADNFYISQTSVDGLINTKRSP